MKFVNDTIKKDFPMLNNEEKQFIYLDSSSTSLKPKCVLDSINEFYTMYTSNAYRGDYINSEIVSLKIDECRGLIATLLNCSENEVIFTSNCSESINLLVHMLEIKKGNKVICSILEHHSNLLPWLEVADVSVVSVDLNGIIELDELEKLLSSNKIKLVSITAVSNVTGNIQPIKKICKLAHKYNALAVIDCCQYLPHHEINVVDIDCDFLAFSAHKMCGPSGLGVLYGKKEILTKCKKVKFGGGMVDKIVDFNNIRYKEIPYCFECGTLAIENIIGFGSALRYLMTLGYDKITNHNKELNEYFYKKIQECQNVKMLFPVSTNHVPIFTFGLTNEKLNIHYIAKILSDAYNICVSAGYQCAQPLYRSINQNGGIRASLQFYNTKKDIDIFFEKINELNI